LSGARAKAQARETELHVRSADTEGVGRKYRAYTSALQGRRAGRGRAPAVVDKARPALDENDLIEGGNAAEARTKLLALCRPDS